MFCLFLSHQTIQFLDCHSIQRLTRTIKRHATRRRGGLGRCNYLQTNRLAADIRNIGEISDIQPEITTVLRRQRATTTGSYRLLAREKSNIYCAELHNKKDKRRPLPNTPLSGPKHRVAEPLRMTPPPPSLEAATRYLPQVVNTRSFISFVPSLLRLLQITL